MKTTPIKERPILMSAPMVRATLRDVDPKTQTRRVVKAPSWFEGHLIHGKNEHGCYDVISDHEGGEQMFCPYGQPGDRLWVKETHYLSGAAVKYGMGRVRYRADDMVRDADGSFSPAVAYEPRWRPSIFMPRWASRITLEIVSVRVERLQEISDVDAKAEGCQRGWFLRDTLDGEERVPTDYRGGYKVLWESINGKGSWALNPWVWVIAFRRCASTPAATAPA